MQKTVLTQAVAVALATLGMGSAFAQSSLTLYGNADVSVDHVKKTAGVPLVGSATTTSTILVPTGLPAPAPPFVAAPANVINANLTQGFRTATQGGKSSVTRVSPSGSSQTSFGLRGEENLGDGYKASFVLEGQLSHDTGALSQDGRIFGRQSYVGLTTPFGEIRLGRQYAPIFYSTAAVTGERFGATDLFIEGGVTNNLMVRQDNQVSYWVKAGGFTGSVAFSPNAGTYSKVNAARSAATSSAPESTPEGGGILGQANAGTETDSKLGRSIGLFGNYAFDSNLNATFGYHRNDFDGATFGAYVPTDDGFGYAESSPVDKYQAINFGLKYILPASNIMLNATYGQGQYDMTGDGELKLRFMAAGIRVPLNQWTFSGQISQIKFTNFTKGKDTGLMFGAEYALSKRTVLYARAVQIRDDEGEASNAAGLTVNNFEVPGAGGQTANVNVGVVGGPDVVTTALGLREIPVFAGAGLNAGGKTTYIGAGIRHSF